jgi:hypothetical protein
MNVSEVEDALGNLRVDPDLLGSMVKLSKSIEGLQGSIKRCEACGSTVLDLWGDELQGLAASLVEFVARLQGRGRKAAGKGGRHEARR